MQTPFFHLKKIILLISISLLAACTTSPNSIDPQNQTDSQISINSNSDAQYEEEAIVDEAARYLGVGAQEVGKALESVFSRFGRPNAYITGSEAGAGLVVGLRYGGGELNHKIEGMKPVHWTGPSIGFDAGADTAKTFALVYNIYDTQEIFTRIGALEGSFFYIGGMGISVYKGENLTIAMVRLGVGLRAQASVGYLKFTPKRSFNPF